MHNPSPTNPGLTYDPRHKGAARFFETLQKELAKQSKKIRAPVPKPKDYHQPKPLPDPGRPLTGNFMNPRFKGLAGFAVRV